MCVFDWQKNLEQDLEMEKITFTFNGTRPTLDGSSVDYIFDVYVRGFNWQISKRFSEFESLLENVWLQYPILTEAPVSS